MAKSIIAGAGLLLIVSGCNTFADPELSSNDTDSGDVDAGMADSGGEGLSLLPPETCASEPRWTSLDDTDFLATAQAAHVSAVWTEVQDASRVSVGTISDDRTASVFEVAIPTSGSQNRITNSMTVRSDWALPEHQATDLDLLGGTDVDAGPRLVVTSDPCAIDSTYGYMGLLGGATQFAIPVPCVEQLLPRAVEFVGGISEFDDISRSQPVLLVAEFFDDALSVVRRAEDEEFEGVGFDIIPSAPVMDAELDLRGTSGELALTLNSNEEVFVVWAPLGLIQPLRDAEARPMTRASTAVVLIYLSRDRYAVAHANEDSITLALYRLTLSDDLDAPPFSFDFVDIIEEIPLDAPRGVGMAPFRNGIALAYLEDIGSELRWTMRPYTVLEDEFTPFECGSTRTVEPFELLGVEMVARRSPGGDLAVQMVTTIAPAFGTMKRVNVEGFVFANFFGL